MSFEPCDSASKGTTARLIQLCLGYFFFYVVTGVAVKFFLSTEPGYPALDGMEYLVYNTAGGTFIATAVVLILRWHRFESTRRRRVLGIEMPAELPYIVASGICTAVVVPTTTLLYSFKGISVMVAMVIMRGAVIVIGRVVDAIQIRQGILKKRVYPEENAAMVIALVAVGTTIFGGEGKGGASPFHSIPVLVIFGSYIAAYSVRIYLMNYFKNTRPPREKGDSNTAYFAVEQLTSTTALILAAATALILAKSFGFEGERLSPFVDAVAAPNLTWAPWAFLAGIGYGIVAFFSVFLFMFQGRTATFAGLVNRLTSLVAGTAATLVVAFAFGGKFPKIVDWVSLAFILVAVAFMARAEKKRRREIGLA